jgi:hypothetical protein
MTGRRSLAEAEICEWIRVPGRWQSYPRTNQIPTRQKIALGVRLQASVSPSAISVQAPGAFSTKSTEAYGWYLVKSPKLGYSAWENTAGGWLQSRPVGHHPNVPFVFYSRLNSTQGFCCRPKTIHKWNYKERKQIKFLTYGIGVKPECACKKQAFKLLANYQIARIVLVQKYTTKFE